MSEPNSQHDTTIDEELVAYLDGELDAEAARRFDGRLADDAALREKLKQHQRAWDLLDELPRTDVGDRFAQTTVEMIAVSVASQVEDTGRQSMHLAKFSWLLGGVVVVVGAVAGYAWIASIAAAPNQQLVKDLRVLENLDEYRAIEDIEFLRALDREGVFAVEVVDGM